MSNKKRGLPDDFDLGVTQEDNTTPVELDDYLDRQLMPKKKSAPKPKKKVISLPVENKEVKRDPTPTPKRPVKRPRRKEITLDAATERQVHEVLTDLRQQGPQPDISVSEYIRCIARLGYDVRHIADFSYLKPRGQWGSTTAKAFVDDLKDAFFRAVGQLYIERYSEAAHQQLEKIISRQKKL